MAPALALGCKVKDKITGFTGIVIGHVTYISGCNQCLVVPPVDKDGKRRDGEWFDEQRLEVLKAPVITLDNSKARGFDQPAPLR